MGKRLPWGWRNIKGISLDEDMYLALCSYHGRGVIKKTDGIWFFIKSNINNPINIPIFLLENVFCLYPIRKCYEDTNSLPR